MSRKKKKRMRRSQRNSVSRRDLDMGVKLMVTDPAEASTDSGAKTKPKRVIKQRQSLSEKQTGTTIFPISRIKKICKADKDLDILTSEATFMISVATVSCWYHNSCVVKLT
jgi:hypothetical protein